MEAWIDQIKAVLDRAPTRALPFSSLTQSLDMIGAYPTGKKDWIIKTMASKREEFTVIPDRLGPWVYHPTRKGPPAAVEPFGSWEPDPWVLSHTPPPRAENSGDRIVQQIRECLGAWGQEVDIKSQRAVAGWIGANREADRALGRLVTSDPGPA